MGPTNQQVSAIDKHSTKTESLHRIDFATRYQARRAVFDYMWVFYNRKRMHSAVDYASPAEFERMAEVA